MVSDFEELSIYQQSRALAKQVYEITRQGEFKYDTRFVQQMRASSGSISDNIAEGFERQGNREFLHFLYIAKGSCGEFRSQINRGMTHSLSRKRLTNRYMLIAVNLELEYLILLNP